MKGLTMGDTNIVDHTELLRLLDYCPESGLFTWKVCLSNRSPVGSIAGMQQHGYVIISIHGRKYRAHKLAIYYYSGLYPFEDVDHRDGSPGNNAILNLRTAGALLNAQNRRRPSKNNKSGLLGVYRCSTTGRWRTSIMVRRKKVNLGRFDTPEEAHRAYVLAKRKLHEGNTL